MSLRDLRKHVRTYAEQSYLVEEAQETISKAKRKKEDATKKRKNAAEKAADAIGHGRKLPMAIDTRHGRYLVQRQDNGLQIEPLTMDDDHAPRNS